jgi:hypothetical protein
LAKIKNKKLRATEDLTRWYSDIAFVPSEDKNELWCAQFTFYLYLNAAKFLQDDKWHAYNKLDKLEIDRETYIQMIDPTTPMGGGGTAEYFSADFKTIPIDIHVDNILRAKLDKIGFDNKLQVNEIDKFAKSQKQRDKDRIIYQREFRKLINSVHEQLGLPPLKDSQSPYNYVKSLSAKDGDKMIDTVDTFLDYIKSEIKDKQDFALYESYVYKGDIEMAFELGIQHYLINLNKWNNKCEYFNRDLKNHNKFCGLWYIDETSGRGTVRYVQPNHLFVLPFASKTGEDIVGFKVEEDITFADFVRRFGDTLTDDQLKEVFELNKTFGARHGVEWSKRGGVRGSNAKIRIFFASCLTQDADAFAEKYVANRTVTWENKPLSWYPDKHTPDKYKSQREQKIYNVWYSWYGVPPPGTKLNNNTQADWAWQAKYIFNMKKDVDMYRYGVDMRYAKSQLVIWNDDSRPSYTDIKEAFMPKIRTEWHKFQNCIVNDVSGTFIAHDLIGAVLNATDEGNKINGDLKDKPSGGNGTDAGVAAFRMLRQSGMAWAGLKDTKTGEPVVDPQKLFVKMDNGLLDKAEKHLKLILDQYNLMMIALAQNSVSEGQNPKTHTAVEGLQQSMNAVDNGMWFVEKPARECLIMYGERCVQFILSMIKENKKYGYKKRFEEFSEVIGLANVLALEGIEDLEPEEIGLTVTLEDTRANQQYIVELANKMAEEDKVAYDAIGLVMQQAQVNWKYAYCLLMIAVKKKAQEEAHKQELIHKQQLELEQARQKTVMMGIQGKAQGKDSNIEKQGEVDAKLAQLENQLKAITMAMQKEQLLNNKLRQEGQKHQLQREDETYDELAPTGS